MVAGWVVSGVLGKQRSAELAGLGVLTTALAPPSHVVAHRSISPLSCPAPRSHLEKLGLFP
ncbi:MAG: hypothetical protein KY450_11900, partial [Actinobacteria bacterium]|nr:hypothetical protein [Actinomycetota bacterium]